MSCMRQNPDPRIRRRGLLRWSMPGFLLALLASPLLAEVSVVTDGRGRPVRTVNLTEVRGGRRLYWSEVRRGVAAGAALNPQGDRMGDGPPTIGMEPQSHQPWVVWSASDGFDREIAVATWVEGRWQGPQLIERVDNPYPDLAPRLAFDSRGNPVVVWWRLERTPRVYLSVFRDGIWSAAVPLSHPDTPSRNPSVRVEGSRAIVTFYTPQGQTVLFQDLNGAEIVLEGGPLDGPVPPPDFTPPPDHSGGHGDVFDGCNSNGGDATVGKSILGN